jgi:hypothetical protein
MRRIRAEPQPTAFDGLSFEVERRIVERSDKPVRRQLALELSWSRLDAVAGTRSMPLRRRPSCSSTRWSFRQGCTGP